MKLKVRSNDANALQEPSLPQMDDWLAQLRDDSQGEALGDGRAGADGADHPWSEALAQADARAEPGAAAQADVRAEPGAAAQADAGARDRAPAEADARAATTERAVIGDQLRMPIMWCEMGLCISWYTDPDALGDADTRARAIGAGWRIDALGRLACPQCQQTDPWFWASHPVVPWDRYTAIARAGRVAAMSGESTADTADTTDTADSADSAAGATGPDPDRAASGFPPVRPGEPGWHHDVPNAQAMPAGSPPANPVATLARAAWPWSTIRARQASGGQAATSPSQ